MDNVSALETTGQVISILRYSAASHPGKTTKAIAKKAKPKKRAKKKPSLKRNWRDTIRLYLAKVPTVDAVFVNAASDTVHVYSIVERFRDDACGELMEQEAKVEKAFPKMPFEFHTRAHQGRNPSELGPWGSELVYLR